jgi:hypothetical protein
MLILILCQKLDEAGAEEGTTGGHGVGGIDIAGAMGS